MSERPPTTKIVQRMPHPTWRGGFTLLEVMLVLVIVGVTLGVAVAKLLPDEHERLRLNTDALRHLLERARDEAIFGGEPIGFRVEGQQLVFLKRDPSVLALRWLPFESEQLSARPWPDDIEVQINVAGRADANMVGAFLPAGVASPFTVSVQLGQRRQEIGADPLGNLSLKVAERPT